MKALSSAEKRALRARAHPLHPVVIVGRQGLTPTVVREIDVGLRAHELIKVRVVSDERAERERMLARICAELDAAPVQHIGKLLIVWRPAPVATAPETAAMADKPSTTKKARARRTPKRVPPASAPPAPRRRRRT